MKRLTFFAVCFATLAFTSCSVLNSAASDTVASSLGQTCGTAILGLYNSYRNTGTVDLTNSNNLTNALALATVYTQLRQNKDNSSFRKAFTSGLVMSSAGLITNSTAGNFINALLSVNQLGTINQSSTTSQVNKTQPAITNLIQTLDKK